MRILALDTSSEKLLATLFDESSPEVLASGEFDVTNHGPGLLPIVDGLLAPHGVNTVEAIVCGTGPGSFTGIRIGLSFAKTFAFLRQVPLFTINVFDCFFTLTEPGDSLPLFVLQDARRGELYAAGHAAGQELLAPCVTDVEAVCGAAPEDARFTGTGVVLHREILEARFPESAFALAGRGLSVELLAAAARRKVATGDSVNVPAAEPLYLRVSDAELNLAAGRLRSAWSRQVTFDADGRLQVTVPADGT